MGKARERTSQSSKGRNCEILVGAIRGRAAYAVLDRRSGLDEAHVADSQ